jgi:hypothetical protein
MSKAAQRPRAAAEAHAVCFVDAAGGAFAALAATLARAHGHAAAAAATTSPAVGVPAEIAVVLDEIGMKAPDVVLAAAVPRGAQRIDVGAWELALHPGEGELERLALARIARDKIERRVEAMDA